MARYNSAKKHTDEPAHLSNLSRSPLTIRSFFPELSSSSSSIFRSRTNEAAINRKEEGNLTRANDRVKISLLLSRPPRICLGRRYFTRRSISRIYHPSRNTWPPYPEGDRSRGGVFQKRRSNRAGEDAAALIYHPPTLSLSLFSRDVATRERERDAPSSPRIRECLLISADIAVSAPGKHHCAQTRASGETL